MFPGFHTGQTGSIRLAKEAVDCIPENVGKAARPTDTRSFLPVGNEIRFALWTSLGTGWERAGGPETCPGPGS